MPKESNSQTAIASKSRKVISEPAVKVPSQFPISQDILLPFTSYQQTFTSIEKSEDANIQKCCDASNHTKKYLADGSRQISEMVQNYQANCGKALKDSNFSCKEKMEILHDERSVVCEASDRISNNCQQISAADNTMNIQVTENRKFKDKIVKILIAITGLGLLIKLIQLFKPNTNTV